MNLSAEQARELADRFLETAEAVKSYRSARRRELPAEERQALKDTEIDLRNQSSDLTTTAVGLTLEGVRSDLEDLLNVTAEAKEAIATAALKLGAALASKNPAAVVAAANELRAEIVA
jgi:hypothetical protein